MIELSERDKALDRADAIAEQRRLDNQRNQKNAGSLFKVITVKKRTERGSFGPGLGREHDGNKPRHVYAMQQVNRVAAEIRKQSMAVYRHGEPARIVRDTQPAPVRSTFAGWPK